MKSSSLIKNASHSAKIPANIVEDTSVAGLNFISSSSTSAKNRRTLEVAMNTSMACWGILCFLTW